MKYISQLTDSELIELTKPFIWGDIKEVKHIERCYNSIRIVALSEVEDSKSEDGALLLDFQFDLYDYDVKIWNYQANNKKEMIRNYRQKLLDKFGNQYALDYLLGWLN